MHGGIPFPTHFASATKGPSLAQKGPRVEPTLMGVRSSVAAETWHGTCRPQPTRLPGAPVTHTLPSVPLQSVDVAACLGRPPGSLGVHPGTEDLRRACDLWGFSGPCGGRPTVLPRNLPGTLNYMALQLPCLQELIPLRGAGSWPGCKKAA